MVWNVAFRDVTKEQAYSLCLRKGLNHKHDVAIWIRRVIDDAINQENELLDVEERSGVVFGRS